MTTTGDEGAALINSRQAAANLGISVETLARWARSGKLPTHHKGEGVRGPRFFRLEDVQLLKARLDQEAATKSQPPAG